MFRFCFYYTMLLVFGWFVFVISLLCLCFVLRFTCCCCPPFCVCVFLDFVCLIFDFLLRQLFLILSPAVLGNREGSIRALRKRRSRNEPITSSNLFPRWSPDGPQRSPDGPQRSQMVPRGPRWSPEVPKTDNFLRPVPKTDSFLRPVPKTD